MSSRSLWKSTCRYCSTLAASAWKALLPPATLTLWSSGRSQTSVSGSLQGGQRCGGLRLSQELLCVQSACSTACVGSPGSHGPQNPLGHPFRDSELATWALDKARKQAGQTRAWPRLRRRIQCAVLLWKLFNADRSFLFLEQMILHQLGPAAFVDSDIHFYSPFTRGGKHPIQALLPQRWHKN